MRGSWCLSQWRPSSAPLGRSSRAASFRSSAWSPISFTTIACRRRWSRRRRISWALGHPRSRRRRSRHRYYGAIRLGENPRPRHPRSDGGHSHRAKPDRAHALAVLKPISSAIAIGTGGPFGAEGPIIMTGGAFGSVFAQAFHLHGGGAKDAARRGRGGRHVGDLRHAARRGPHRRRSCCSSSGSRAVSCQWRSPLWSRRCFVFPCSATVHSFRSRHTLPSLGRNCSDCLAVGVIAGVGSSALTGRCTRPRMRSPSCPSTRCGGR